MNNRIKNMLFILIGLLIAFFIWVFSFEQTRWDFGASIDADRFSAFGTFVSGILSVFVLYMLILTYDETKKQSFDNTFFNFLGVHESVVRELKSRENDIKKLNEFSQTLFGDNCCNTLDDSLKAECKLYEEKTKTEPAHDFFEILYRILHIRHKYKTKMDSEEIEKFFKDYKWRMGHFLRSYITLVELIDKNGHLTIQRKEFYFDILKSRSSSDETRLVFYYILGQYYSAKEQKEETQTPEKNKILEETKWKAIAKVFHDRKIFSEEESSLIWNKETAKSDWAKFERIVKDK